MWDNMAAVSSLPSHLNNNKYYTLMLAFSQGDLGISCTDLNLYAYNVGIFLFP